MTAAQRNANRHRTIGQVRQQQLIARRSVVATAWAEGISHGLPVGDLLEELSILEFALIDQWPHLAEACLRRWVVADAAKLHDPDRGAYPGCTLCHEAARQAA
ncbi:hypothetical protein CELL_01601 [Cellulomonas sp. T2.31MG-18]|uniref:hypothetical protein n=1 Tax=Cellulomonas sp. T2.31MG-18 TaxID=3157619 RepID=UPI0035F0279B